LRPPARLQSEGDVGLRLEFLNGEVDPALPFRPVKILLKQVRLRLCIVVAIAGVLKSDQTSRGCALTAA